MGSQLVSGGLGTGIEPRTIYATVFAKVANLHSDKSSDRVQATFLEGPSFGPEGGLYLADVFAPAGEPKILRLDMESKEVVTVHTDAASAYSSTQFSPNDGKMYVTDLANGRIERMDPDGSHVETVFEGPVDGRTMAPDDLAFDAEGNMYITDFTGTPWEPTGRIVRLSATGGAPIVLQGGLARPNGISFTPDYSRLWISEASASRVSCFKLTEDGTAVMADRSFVGMYVNSGLHSSPDDLGYIALDSNAVDGDGNIYQTVYGGGKIIVWNQSGELVANVTLRDSFSKPQLGVTNLAIEPGTRNGYITVGGHNGGYIYQFQALGEGTSQSNGGGLAVMRTPRA